MPFRTAIYSHMWMLMLKSYMPKLFLKLANTNTVFSLTTTVLQNWAKFSISVICLASGKNQWNNTNKKLAQCFCQKLGSLTPQIYLVKLIKYLQAGTLSPSLSRSRTHREHAVISFLPILPICIPPIENPLRVKISPAFSHSWIIPLGSTSRVLKSITLHKCRRSYS